MIGLVTFALNFLSNRAGIAMIGAVAAFGAYHAGAYIGDGRGYDRAQAEQAVADAEQSAEIRERVKDALQTIGADTSDADVDAVLRKLAGE